MRNKVERRKVYSNLRMAFITVIVLFGIIVTQILLSIAVSSGAYEIAALKQSNKEASDKVQLIKQQVSYLEAPQHLAEKAEELGMVNSTNPVFLKLSDGAVLGVPQASDATDGIVQGQSFVSNDVPESVSTKANTPLPKKTTTPEPTIAPATPVAPAANPNTPVTLTNGLPAVTTR